MNIELDLRRILLIFWKRAWVLLLFMILVGGIAYSISNWFIPKRYSASVSMYVYNQENRTSANVTSSDLATSQKLVSTYIVVLESNSVLNQVSAVLGGKYSAAEIKKMITASSIKDTEAFSVTVTYTDPAAVKKIANTIADVAPSEIKRVVKAGAVEVIDYATVPEKPTLPDVYLNTGLGVIAGLVFAAVLVILIELADTAIRSEEDLAKAFEIPVLGVIPRLYAGNGE